MNFYESIKEQLINNEIYKRVKDYSKNKNELETYYNVGKLLSEAGKHYGEGIIKEYSSRLTNELNVKYDVSSLNKMRKFYNLKEKMVTLSPNLSWSHYVELLPQNDIDKINYYIKICEEQNLSVRKLREKIKSKEYERLPDNTKNKLVSKEDNIEDFIKHPIILKNKFNKKKITEKILKQIILEDIPSFLKQLGSGYSFIDCEYPIKYEDKYNYIDILLFNIKYNCYVVVELKITELKKEHIGQIEHYMNYIDNTLKGIYHNKTVGIIITRENNKFVIKYCSNKYLFQTTYQLS